MSGNYFSNPNPQFLDSNGDPVSGGKVDFFEAGSTTIRQDTFTDKSLTPGNENPNPIILSADGRSPTNIFLQQKLYNVRLLDSANSVIWARDDVLGSAIIPFELAASLQGVPSSLQKILPGFIFTRSISFTVNFVGSRGQGLANATAETDFDIRRGNLGGASSSIGTMRFAAATKVATFIVAAIQTFVAGDYIEVVGPASADATLADVSMTLVGDVL